MEQGLGQLSRYLSRSSVQPRAQWGETGLVSVSWLRVGLGAQDVLGGVEGGPLPTMAALLSSPAVREEAMINSFARLERPQIRSIWASVEPTSLYLPVDLARMPYAHPCVMVTRDSGQTRARQFQVMDDQILLNLHVKFLCGGNKQPWFIRDELSGVFPIWQQPALHLRVLFFLLWGVWRCGHWSAGLWGLDMGNSSLVGKEERAKRERREVWLGVYIVPDDSTAPCPDLSCVYIATLLVWDLLSLLLSSTSLPPSSLPSPPLPVPPPLLHPLSLFF